MLIWSTGLLTSFDKLVLVDVVSVHMVMTRSLYTAKIISVKRGRILLWKKPEQVSGHTSCNEKYRFQNPRFGKEGVFSFVLKLSYIIGVVSLRQLKGNCITHFFMRLLRVCIVKLWLRISRFSQIQK